MKRSIPITIVLLACCLPGFAQEENAASAKRIGMICNIELTRPVTNYTDGVLAGAGVKYWLTDSVALNALTYLHVQQFRLTQEVDTEFGLGVSADYRFFYGTVSPYAGAMAGIEILADPMQAGMDYYLGGRFGAEIATPLKYLSLFIEYSLTMVFRDVGVTVEFGRDHLPSFGFVIYFN